MERLKCDAGERLEDISWTDHVRNAEVLHRVEWGINIVQNRQEKTRNKT